MKRNKTDNTIGGRIRKQREAKGLTQLELAKLLYVKRETVNQWENDTRQIKAEHLAAIAEKLETSCDYLLCRTNTSSSDAEIRAVCDYTHLPQSVVNRLHVENNNVLSGLKMLLQHETFWEVLPLLPTLAYNSSSIKWHDFVGGLINEVVPGTDELVKIHDVLRWRIHEQLSSIMDDIEKTAEMPIKVK